MGGSRRRHSFAGLLLGDLVRRRGHGAVPARRVPPLARPDRIAPLRIARRVGDQPDPVGTRNRPLRRAGRARDRTRELRRRPSGGLTDPDLLGALRPDRARGAERCERAIRERPRGLALVSAGASRARARHPADGDSAERLRGLPRAAVAHGERRRRVGLRVARTGVPGRNSDRRARDQGRSVRRGGRGRHEPGGAPRPGDLAAVDRQRAPDRAAALHRRLRRAVPARAARAVDELRGGRPGGDPGAGDHRQGRGRPLVGRARQPRRAAPGVRARCDGLRRSLPPRSSRRRSASSCPS